MLKRRKFFQTVAASLVSNTVIQKIRQVKSSSLLKSSNNNLANSISEDLESINAEIIVDWSTVIAQTTPLIFSSNDYEITSPQKAADSIFQNLLTELDIPLIRVHHALLSERWTDSTAKSWDEAKIQACYDASYFHNPKIVQNIPRWPSWMKLDSNSLLDSSEYDNYANFCGELVRILNQTQNRQIIYWEPFNELDTRYKNAGQLNELWKIYNKVTERMKNVDPQIKVGGPVLTWDDSQTLNHFLDSCSQNVDFISWHRYASGNANAPTDKIMSFTPKYGDQTRRFRSIVTRHIPERKVPLFLSEYNINYSWDSGETRQNTHVGAVWFASVFKHLAEAEIDMAASWHLKDGIYGMIDPQNNLRPSARIFALAIKYLTGNVIQNESDRPFIEALPVQQQTGDRSLLLINKLSEYANINLTEMYGSFQTGETIIHSLDANGIEVFDADEQTNLNTFTLSPYSILLLRSSQPVYYSD
ncbi:Alpha-L-arabinofuranosidase [Hyella patelloides LEGE 07179]|uniref:Alpha-L-arabinofuranosidase n=1 Tax=Hyella patelloides LEGE 07179 TaxID=945734 RepID=A0A563W5B6_9CYAN|nr:alpha-L-arabinofuranosidase [Hyella patelloides]VEP18892.1 Alpha-L-arabinofuranosidase [Hyella patelloides LEGE 07179]